MSKNLNDFERAVKGNTPSQNRKPGRSQVSVAEIRDGLEYLWATGDAAYEIRIPKTGFRKRQTHTGFFTRASIREAAIAAAKASGTCVAVYWTLNPMDLALHSRAADRIEDAIDDPDGEGFCAADTDAIRRDWLLLDFDPNRKANISATDSEKEAARVRALACRDWLTERGWPEPVFADSGNGYYLLFYVREPNDLATTKLFQAVLNALEDFFGDDLVKFDTTVYNASQSTRSTALSLARATTRRNAHIVSLTFWKSRSYQPRLIASYSTRSRRLGQSPRPSKRSRYG